MVLANHLAEQGGYVRVAEVVSERFLSGPARAIVGIQEANAPKLTGQKSGQNAASKNSAYQSELGFPERGVRESGAPDSAGPLSVRNRQPRLGIAFFWLRSAPLA
ncbi:MAG: hypothetical protein AAF989_06535 [Planctomycetota bacterium]